MTAGGQATADFVLPDDREGRGGWLDAGLRHPGAGRTRPADGPTAAAWAARRPVEREPNTVEVLVTVHNTGTLIGGYQLRVLGADPSWVAWRPTTCRCSRTRPDGHAPLVRIPPGVAAGERRMAVQVRELTPPQAISIAEIELWCRRREALRVTLTPMTVIGGGPARSG